MKNLITMGIERLIDVPIEHLSHRPTQAKKADWFGYKYDRGWYKLRYTSPSTIVSRIIEKYMGKSFNDAFSYYCKLVPRMYQKEFLEEFEPSRGTSSSYITDKNGNIKDNPLNPWKGRYKRRRNAYKGPYVINSHDFKTEWRHKETDHKRDDFTEVYEQIPYKYSWKTRFGVTHREGVKNGEFLYYEYGSNPLRMKPLHERYRAQKEDFHSVIIQGWQKVFKSKQDPEFIRLQAEKWKKSKILSKKKRLEEEQRVYDMISKTELEKKKQKELNDQVIVRHGFDLVSSFRK